jgi:serine protease Do
MTRNLLTLLLLALPATLLAQDAPKKRAMVGVQIAQAKEGAPILIRVVLDNSPAMKAGLKSGDRIIRIDGAKPETLLATVRIIQSLKPGKKAKFLIERDGKERTIEVTPIATDE